MCEFLANWPDFDLPIDLPLRQYLFDELTIYKTNKPCIQHAGLPVSDFIFLNRGHEGECTIQFINRLAKPASSELRMIDWH